MVELPGSPLPGDPDYWERLAREIGDDAAGPLAAYAAARGAWYDVLARQAPWLLAASLAAMAALWLALPASRQVSPALVWMERSLRPAEPAGTLVAAPEPPRVDVLMAQFPPPPRSPNGEVRR